MKKARSWLALLEEKPEKAVLVCCAGLFLFALVAYFYEDIQKFLLVGRNNPLLIAGCLIALLGGFFVLYKICAIIAATATDVSWNSPSRRQGVFDGKWYLRRRGITLILSFILCLWLISIPIRSWLAAKIDLTYNGRRLTLAEGHLFEGEIESILKQLRQATNSRGLYEPPALSTEMGRDISDIAFGRNGERAALNKRLSDANERQKLTNVTNLLTDRGVDSAKGLLEEIVLAEGGLRTLDYQIRLEMCDFIRKMSDTPSLLDDPPPLVSPEPFLNAYRKLFEFTKGRKRRLQGMSLVFVSPSDQRLYQKLLLAAKDSVAAFERESEQIRRSQQLREYMNSRFH